MRCYQFMGAALAVGTAVAADAQNRSALCGAAHERLATGLEIGREMMQAPLAGIDTATQLAAEMTDEQQVGAIEVLEIVIEESLQGLEERNRQFADNQAALARVLFELCGEDWPDEAPVPPEAPAPPREGAD